MYFDSYRLDYFTKSLIIIITAGRGCSFSYLPVQFSLLLKHLSHGLSQAACIMIYDV